MTAPTLPSEQDLRYPIGKSDMKTPLAAGERAQRIDFIAALPAQLRKAVKGLTDAQLDTPYRPGGWTVRQLVHHVADSHMNAFIRFRLGLTEDNPTIKPYDEKAWCELPDTKHLPVEVSLDLLDALHERFKAWVRSRRGDRLKADEAALFDGSFMLGDRALECGLIDGLADIDSLVRKLGGERMRTRVFRPRRRGLLRRLPSLAVDALLDAIEERSWRIGLR